jgi:hypothetical protein
MQALFPGGALRVTEGRPDGHEHWPAEQSRNLATAEARGADSIGARGAQRTAPASRAFQPGISIMRISILQAALRAASQTLSTARDEGADPDEKKPGCRSGA